MVVRPKPAMRNERQRANRFCNLRTRYFLLFPTFSYLRNERWDRNFSRKNDGAIGNVPKNSGVSLCSRAGDLLPSGLRVQPREFSTGFSREWQSITSHPLRVPLRNGKGRSLTRWHIFKSTKSTMECRVQRLSKRFFRGKRPAPTGSTV